MSGLLAPVIREQYLGQAEVRDTFNVPKIGTVAGCGVLDADELVTGFGHAFKSLDFDRHADRRRTANPRQQ